MATRFDKHGNELELTGHGCGCKLCAQARLTQERRRAHHSHRRAWSPARRGVYRFVKTFWATRPQVA